MIHIRQVEMDDREGVVSCVHSASIANKRDYPDEFIDNLNEKGYTLEWITKKIEKQTYFLVAVKGDEIVGTVSHRDNQVVNVFVRHNFQGLGIGKKLMERIESHLRSQGYGTIYLSANLTSVGFYQSIGFKVIEENVEEIEEFVIKSFQMEKNL